MFLALVVSLGFAATAMAAPCPRCGGTLRAQTCGGLASVSQVGYCGYSGTCQILMDKGTNKLPCSTNKCEGTTNGTHDHRRWHNSCGYSAQNVCPY